jgi:hypothetical protein
MRFPGTTIRQLLLLVAALALALSILAALHRRSVRFRQFAGECLSARGAVYFNNTEDGRDGQELTIEAVSYPTLHNPLYETASTVAGQGLNCMQAIARLLLIC